MPSPISNLPSPGEAGPSPISHLPSTSKPLDPQDEVLVRVEGVSKIFCRDLKKSLWYGLQDSAKDLFAWGRRIEDGRLKMEDGGSKIEDEIPSPISHLLSPGEANPSSLHPISHIPSTISAQRLLRSGEFLAVDNVSFELRRGECLGLIGRNGAGKTTLLKMLNGLIKPDAGQIEMRGRIGALIALGAGFNPVLSGRENIYINGSILGLSNKEVDEKIDGIIEFAEIRDFIDAPIQSYSSGMQVRLGFAVATAMEPDILILDEVLAVGDVKFQVKCYTKIADILAKCAVIFVSHSMNSIARMSDRVLLLHNGIPSLSTTVQEGIVKYYEISHSDGPPIGGTRVETGIISLKNISVNVINEHINSNISSKTIAVKFQLEASQDTEFLMTFVFRNMSGQSVAECPSSRTSQSLRMISGESKHFCLTIEPVFLASGPYLCSIYALDIKCVHHYLAWVDFAKIDIIGDNRYTAPVQLSGDWKY